MGWAVVLCGAKREARGKLPRWSEWAGRGWLDGVAGGDGREWTG